MKKQSFVLTLLLSFVVLTINMQAQSSYKSAIGARLGYPLSVSYKHFINEKAAVEVFGGFRPYTNYSWSTIGGLYQLHAPIAELDGLKWYWGGGAAVYFWSFKNGFVYGDAGNTSIGILGCLGLDYKLDSAPVNFSLDWIPSYFVNGYGSGFGGGYGALAVRYTLK